jgi:recombination protein RecA
MAKVIIRKNSPSKKPPAPIEDEPKPVVKTKAAPKAKKLIKKSAPDNFSANFMAGALKVLGKNSEATIEVLKEDEEIQNITSTIKLGIPQLDEMLCDSKDYGMSGLPIGRSMELFGKQVSCKTAIIEWAAARVSAAGGRVLYLDYERAMDPKHLKGYGADYTRIQRAKLDSMEDGWNVIYAFLKALPKDGPPNLIVWDTVAAAPTKDELEGKNGMAHQARIMSVHTRIFRGRLMRSNCAAIFVNQVRTKPGVTWGDPTSRPCGSALDFMCDVMVKTTNIGTEFKKIKGVNTPISYNIQWRTFKARFSQAKKNVVWSLSLKTGVDQPTSIIKHLVAEGVAKQTDAGVKIPGVGVHTAASLAEWIEEQGEEEALDMIMKTINVPTSKDEKPKKGKAPEPLSDDEDEDQESLEDSDD